MIGILFTLPAIVLCLAYLMYPYSGKKEWKQMDLVQWMYALFFPTVIFLWGKAVLVFLFFYSPQELTYELLLQFIFFDVLYSLVALMMQSFNMVHSLTKTFSLKREKSKNVDLFPISEYFHSDVSHFFTFGGMYILAIFFALLNFFIPLHIVGNQLMFSFYLASGLATGFYIGKMIGFHEGRKKFRRYLSSIILLSFVMLISLFFWNRPTFSMQYGFYWIVLAAFFVSNVMIVRQHFFLHLSAKTR